MIRAARPNSAGSWSATQANLVIVKAATGTLPVVGIPLPLFSYGGSSLLSFLIGIGIIMSVQMRRFTFSRREL